jgi:hypothetical protein
MYFVTLLKRKGLVEINTLGWNLRFQGEMMEQWFMLV